MKKTARAHFLPPLSIASLTCFFLITGCHLNKNPKDINTSSTNNDENAYALYDAAANVSQPFINRTTATGKDKGGYIAKTKRVETTDGPALKFTFSGTTGMSRSIINVADSSHKLEKQGYTIKALKFNITYPENDFGKIAFTAWRGQGAMSSSSISLLKGNHEYVFKAGHLSGGGISQDWAGLKQIAIIAHPGPRSPQRFFLRTITALVEKRVPKGQIKELPINCLRPSQEILLAKSPLNPDKTFKKDYDWNKLSTLQRFYYLSTSKQVPNQSCPTNVRIGYDDKNLFIHDVTYYPTKPLSSATQRDREVWQDEGVELFFSAETDNDRHWQYVVNSEGVIFDKRRAFDHVAAGILTKTQSDLPATQNITYDDQKLTTKFCFALKDLSINLTKKRFIGFQLVQNYRNREEPELQSFRWAEAKGLRNHAPYGWGYLVFNKKAFGSGKISIKKLLRQAPPQATTACFRFNLLFEDFIPAEYQATQYLVAPDKSITSKPCSLKLGANANLDLVFPNGKNINGDYTWILEIKNSSGDARLIAINFKNEKELIDLFGKAPLWPRPKHVVFGDDFFLTGTHNAIGIPANATKRTLLTTKLFQEKLRGYAGKDYKLSTTHRGAINLSIAQTAAWQGKTVELKSEGYYLRVTPDSVDIIGADEPGLFYGTITFIQLLKRTMKRLDNAPAQCVEILDWPDLSKRLARLWPADQIGAKVSEKLTIKELLPWIDRFVAGQKFNLFPLQIGCSTIFKRRPEVNWNLEARSFSLEDWKVISQFCEQRFIELIPRLPAGGHDHLFGKARKDFREKGWENTTNIAHPDYFPTYSDCALDLIEATQCKYFTPKLDEWWHKRKLDETPDDLLHGKTHAEALKEFIIKLHAFLKEHGVRLIVFEDMLSPYHNGTRYNVYKITKDLPKDIIINFWANVGGPVKSVKYFYDLGFKELWANQTAFSPIPEAAKKYYSGYGTGLYGWLGGGVHPYSHQYSFQYMYAWFRGADYAWNFSQDKGQSLDDEINSGVLPALSETFAVAPNPFASQDTVPLDISASFNNNLSAFMRKNWPEHDNEKESMDLLPTGVREIGNIATHFGEGKKNCVVVDSKRNVTFPIKGKYSSLIFLHSSIKPQNIKELAYKLRFGGYRRWQLGYPMGSYTIQYADKTSEKVIIHLGLETYWLRQRPLGGGTVYNRYIYHPQDANGDYVFLYQYEWVNPFPEKEIVSVTFDDKPEIPMKNVIFAISGRKVKEVK